jgi:hypothetical protein
MDWRFPATPQAVEALARSVADIPGIQRRLVDNHAALRQPDRAAHQQQIAAGRVVLEVARELPPELDGLGVFRRGATTVGIGRISTGLGCPHLETDPDFLGLMLAFQTADGARVDFLGINDASAPTDTVDEFMALLAATAAAAGAEIPFGDVGELDLGNLTAAQAVLFNELRKRLGLVRATTLYLHLARQTTRTALSSSAVQQYWTGVVEAGQTLGKFTFVPTRPAGAHRRLRPGPRHLSEDWERRCREGPIEFTAKWIPFVSEAETPLETLSTAWSERHAVAVGSVSFQQADSQSHDARLLALLASEMGANPGHWVATRDGEPRREYPGTTFTAARQVAYTLGQRTRGALADEACASFFATGGTIGPELERELARRCDEKRRAGHVVPVGESAG